MNLTFLSNLTKSPDTPKVPVAHQQTMSQESAFADILREISQPTAKSATVLPTAGKPNAGDPEAAKAEGEINGEATILANANPSDDANLEAPKQLGSVQLEKLPATKGPTRNDSQDGIQPTADIPVATTGGVPADGGNDPSSLNTTKAAIANLSGAESGEIVESNPPKLATTRPFDSAPPARATQIKTENTIDTILGTKTTNRAVKNMPGEVSVLPERAVTAVPAAPSNGALVAPASHVVPSGSSPVAPAIDTAPLRPTLAVPAGPSAPINPPRAVQVVHAEPGPTTPTQVTHNVPSVGENSSRPHLALGPIQPGLTKDIQLPTKNGDAVQPISRPEQRSTPMTMLERHLGGHPATLLPDAKPAQLPGMLIQDAPRFNREDKRATLAPVSLPPQTQTPMVHAPTASVAAIASATKTTAIGVTKPDLSGVNADTNQSMAAFGDEVGWDMPARAQILGSAQISGLPKLDVGNNVAQQIADAVRRTPDKPVEIALNPIELGRVRMVLSASDAGISVSILADRPETLDLLRRNIDDLGKSFSEMGYEDISFSFGQGDQMAQDSEPQETDGPLIELSDTPAIDPMIAAPKHTPTLAIAPDGIDMRL